MSKTSLLDFDKEFLHKTVTLEKMDVVLNFVVSREAPADYIADLIKYMVRGYVWSQDAGKKVEFKYPADWWQAFKERWFPAWLLKSYPVIYTHREFQVKATYPDLVVQNHNPVMRLAEAMYTSWSCE